MKWLQMCIYKSIKFQQEGEEISLSIFTFKRILMSCRRRLITQYSHCVCNSKSLLDAKDEKQNLNAVKWERNVTVALKFALAVLSMTETNEEKLSIRNQLIRKHFCFQKFISFNKLKEHLSGKVLLPLLFRYRKFEGVFETILKRLETFVKVPT